MALRTRIDTFLERHKQVLELVYNLVMFLLAVVSITLVIADWTGYIDLLVMPYLGWDLAILLVFAVDYLVRLTRSADRSDFVRANIPDLLAILPFSEVFVVFKGSHLIGYRTLLQIGKIASVFRLFRLVAFVGVIRKKSRKISKNKRSGLAYILYTLLVLVGLLLGSAVFMTFVEGPLTGGGFGDYLWWAIVTVTTVGYGDISPITQGGKIAAAVLMISSVGMVAMLTGTVASFFAERVRTRNSKNIYPDLVALANELNEGQLEDLVVIGHLLKSHDLRITIDHKPVNGPDIFLEDVGEEAP